MGLMLLVSQEGTLPLCLEAYGSIKKHWLLSGCYIKIVERTIQALCITLSGKSRLNPVLGLLTDAEG
jgi:hypothetical protein